MGSNEGRSNEKPVHKITVSSFKMSKYEITLSEFAEFIKATGYKTDAEKEGYSLKEVFREKNVFFYLGFEVL